jgi:hypothetical protein
MGQKAKPSHVRQADSYQREREIFMAETNVDLASLFQSVTQTLAENQQTLNQADDRNQDHGTNMVQTFQTITEALEKKKGNSASAALSYAAQTLSKSTNSGSGQLYAQNLTRAAAQLKGQKIDPQGALQLLQTLIGSGQAPAQGTSAAGGADMLGSLLGGIGGGQAPAQGASAAGGADMLGSLLGAMGGEQGSAQGASAAGGADMLGSLLGAMGGGQAPAQGASAAGGADMLGALLGSLGGEQAPAQGASAAGGADMLGALLGGLGGQAPAQGASAAGAQGGPDLTNLLSAGMAFLQAKQSGGSTGQALIRAFMAGSGMGNTTHRTQSTQLVVNSFLQALGGMTGQQ